MCNSINMRRKLKEAETHEHLLFERRGHQNDDTGEGDEGSISSYVNMLFESFDFIEERAGDLASVRANRWRNIRVNRSVIGQQPTLSGFDNPTLNTTVATPGREIGSGEVAGEIAINETSQDSSESNNDISEESRDTRSRQTFIGPSKPQRRSAPNDGGSNRVTRSRRYNISNYPTLPPFTGRQTSIGWRWRWATILLLIRLIT